MEMDSPNSSKPHSFPAQESPIFSYISNLSPLAEKVPAATQDFQGLGSPSLVFTSPQHKFQTQTTYLKRAAYHGLSATQLSHQNECCIESDVMNMDSTIKPSVYVDQPPDTKGTKDDEHNKRITEEIATSPRPLTRQTEDEEKADYTTDATETETDVKDKDVVSDQCISIGPELSVGHSVTNQELEEPMTELQVEKTGRGFPLAQSSHLLSESTRIVEDNGDFVEAAGETLSRPALEVTQHRGILRRCLQFEDAQNLKVIPSYPDQNHEDSMDTQSLKRPLRLANEKWDVTLQPVSYPKNNPSSNVIVRKPIGLHLNKIVNFGQSEPVSIADKNRARMSSFSIRGNKLIPIMNSLSDKGLSRTDDHRSFSTYTIKPLNKSADLNPVDNEPIPSNKMNYNTVIDGVSEEFDKLSAKKKRKTSSDTNDSNGCKRCNCKKSNCLKLYCDCFAAGIYCAGPCACVACLNRPQYEETVLAKRQQIESRNPLAFAPKVVKHLTQPLPPESSFENNQTLFTPSSARHKRGCNCKKSMCVKKYCECYQANVGCSDGCRCEGCQNAFGCKGDLGMKDVANDENTSEKAEGSSGENFKLLSSGSSLYSSEHLNPHNLTPPTPAFQFTDHRKNVSEAWFPSGNFQSPSPDCNTKISDATNEIVDMGPFDPALHCGDNADTVNDFSPENMELISGSNHQIWANDTRVESFSVNRQYSSATSFHWHGSPNTPMAANSGTTKYLQASMQDTPYVLSDAPMPQNNVKVISPSKKRVSPPRLNEIGSSSSGVVKTGRKFILKAVPSFPPLTPSVDSKTAGVEPTDDPQFCSIN